MNYSCSHRRAVARFFNVAMSPDGSGDVLLFDFMLQPGHAAAQNLERDFFQNGVDFFEKVNAKFSEAVPPPIIRRWLCAPPLA